MSSAKEYALEQLVDPSHTLKRSLDEDQYKDEDNSILVNRFNRERSKDVAEKILVNYLDEQTQQHFKVNFTHEDSLSLDQGEYCVSTSGNLLHKYAATSPSIRREVFDKRNKYTSGVFRHSSLAERIEGTPGTLAAGDCKISKGKITYMDNVSGHFKPNPINLYIATQLFKEHFTPEAQIGVRNGQQKIIGEDDLDIYPLNDFITKMQQQLDKFPSYKAAVEEFIQNTIDKRKEFSGKIDPAPNDGHMQKHEPGKHTKRLKFTPPTDEEPKDHNIKLLFRRRLHGNPIARSLFN